jgi:hypothetical protein
MHLLVFHAYINEMHSSKEKKTQFTSCLMMVTAWMGTWTLEQHNLHGLKNYMENELAQCSQ